MPGRLGVLLAIQEASRNLEKQEVKSVHLVGCTTDGTFQKLPKHVLISRRDTEAGSQWVAVSGISCSGSKGKTLDRIEDRELQRV
jgi:hypothetical protein